MTKRSNQLKMPLWAALFVGAALFLPGCIRGRDVQVSGTVTSSAASADPSGEEHGVLLEFYDTRDGGWQFVRSTSRATAGDFEETVYIEGDEVRVVAIDDPDSSGDCTPGEAWGVGIGRIREDDTTASIPVDLAEQRACPPHAD